MCGKTRQDTYTRPRWAMMCTFLTDSLRLNHPRAGLCPARPRGGLVTVRARTFVLINVTDHLTTSPPQGRARKFHQRARLFATCEEKRRMMCVWRFHGGGVGSALPMLDWGGLEPVSTDVVQQPM